MITSKINVNGSDFIDYQNLRFTKTLSENNTISTFNVTIDSPFGRHKNDFVVGNDVKIYTDQNVAPSTLNFRGLIDTVEFKGEGLDQKAILRGRGYEARLIDNTVQPTVYTNWEIGSIVRDIITNNLTDIGSQNVNTTQTTLKRIAFKHNGMFDALKQLADLCDYSFYIDTNKDLHFEPLASGTSNITIGSQNILSVKYDKTRENMANKVWVYGDRYLVNIKELNRLDGSTWGGAVGSVFTLQYNPNSTQVEYLGSIRKGGIYNANLPPTSGNDFLVSYFDKTLIFQSGTSIGYSSIPISGGSIITTYGRSIPIVKYGELKSSIQAFGPKSLVITDKTISDPNTATAIVNEKITMANPLRNIEVDLKGWYTFTPGQSVNIVIPDFNLTAQNVPIISLEYNLDARSVAEERVITALLDKRQLDLTDKIAEIKRKIDALEAADKQSTDLLTRLEYSYGTVQTIGSSWYVKTRSLGSEFRVWGSNNVPPMSGTVLRLGLLVSGDITHASWIGSVSYLTSGTIQPWNINYSGGYAYT